MHFFLHGWYAEIRVCYKRWNKSYTIWDIKMKLIHKLFHKMMNRSWKFQGCSLIYVGMANYLDVPVLSLTVGKSIRLALDITMWGHTKVKMYRVFRYLRPPPPQPMITLIHMKIVYFHDPTSIPDYHASFQNYSSIDQLPVSWFMCQSRAHFHEQFQAVFLGWLSKNSHKIVNNWLRLLYHTSF